MKYPEKGNIKTRLAKSIGDDATYNIYKCFIKDMYDKLESLINKEHIERKIVNNQEVLSLTDKGKTSFKEILKTFSAEYLNETETDGLITEFFCEEKIPSFIGAFVADKDGRTLERQEIRRSNVA